MSKHKVIFICPILGSSVSLAGSFNSWVPQEMSLEDNKYQLSLLLESPGTYYYKFVVDNKWIIDNDKPSAPDGCGNINNVITLLAKSNNPSETNKADNLVIPQSTPSAGPLQINPNNLSSNIIIPPKDNPPKDTSTPPNNLSSNNIIPPKDNPPKDTSEKVIPSSPNPHTLMTKDTPPQIIEYQSETSSASPPPLNTETKNKSVDNSNNTLDENITSNSIINNSNNIDPIDPFGMDSNNVDLGKFSDNLLVNLPPVRRKKYNHLIPHKIIEVLIQGTIKRNCENIATDLFAEMIKSSTEELGCLYYSWALIGTNNFLMTQLYADVGEVLHHFKYIFSPNSERIAECCEIDQILIIGDIPQKEHFENLCQFGNHEHILSRFYIKSKRQ